MELVTLVAESIVLNLLAKSLFSQDNAEVLIRIFAKWSL